MCLLLSGVSARKLRIKKKQCFPVKSLRPRDQELAAQLPAPKEFSLKCIIEQFFPLIFVGLLQAKELGLEVFHGATTIKDDKVVINGGRVLTVTALKDDLTSALEAAYKGLAAIYFQGAIYQKDVGYQAMKFLRQSVYVSKGTDSAFMV